MTLYWLWIAGLIITALVLLGYEFMDWLEGEHEQEALGDQLVIEHARPLGNVVVLDSRRVDSSREQARAQEAESDS